MCETLAEVRSAVTVLAGCFDAHELSQTAARRALRDTSAIEHAAATMRMLLSARIAEGSDYQREGFRCPAGQIAKVTGGQAFVTLDVGQIQQVFLEMLIRLTCGQACPMS
jgi:hypothetical protein